MNRFPGYARLIGPEQLTIDGNVVTSAALYLLWHTSIVTGRGGKPWDTTAPPGRPYVNEGRCLVTCYWCKNGMLTREDWAVAFCGECGARYRGIAFPSNFQDIERLLCQRPDRTTQHWGVPPLLPNRYEQTAEEIAQENREELGLCCS